ncbi:septal ring factor EnvC (AmiA/AmiB activator) [Povalibacter uvarum]|uniref:Septal ring factor EnvC (AmiA/AmiB activator) n=1 Tax=Povalibacter uvarum TaxID=732238 RepID=A0A841HJ75_9GAMM|nr:peptidoglycan DD-metalloendopeptidase family protein [Povalibacter uvarum]MBB6093067.1 septal ring factor EnvC (AmiA/AmiB activator) [Povalibacter uvarum]
MHPLAARLVIFWMTLLLGSGVLAAADPAAKEAELKQVRTRIESIRKSIHADAEKRDALAVEVRKAELNVQSARERLQAVREQRVAAQQRLQSLEKERAETQRSIDAERDALAGELRVAYVNGRQEQLKLLLNQRDPAQLGRMMAWYSYFGRARAERITSINEHLAHLDLLAENITEETRKLQALEAEQSKEVSSLAGARDTRKQTLAKVQSTLRNRSDQLAKAQREAAALEKLVEQLRRAIEEFPDLGDQPFARARGRLPWPVKGSVLARFGQLRSGGPLKWQGMVIGADRGSQVRAPFPGRVVYADWLPGLGLLIVLDHGGGFMSLYGHNEQLYRRVGDRVAAGDPLAAVGDAAGFGKPGLYLEIRKGRQALDPAPWLAKP